MIELKKNKSKVNNHNQFMLGKIISVLILQMGIIPLILVPFIISNILVIIAMGLICVLLVISGAISLRLLSDESNYEVFTSLPIEIPSDGEPSILDVEISEIEEVRDVVSRPISTPIKKVPVSDGFEVSIDISKETSDLKKDINVILSKLKPINQKVYDKLLSQYQEIKDVKKSEDAKAFLTLFKGKSQAYLEKYHDGAKQIVNEYSNIIEEYKSTGVDIGESIELLKKANDNLEKMEINESISLATQSKDIAEKRYSLYMNCQTQIENLLWEAAEFDEFNLSQDNYINKLEELRSSSDYEQVLEDLSSMRSEMGGILEERRSSVADRITTCTDYLENLLTDGISETQPLLDNIPSIQDQYSAGHYTTVLESILKLEESGKEFKERSELLGEIKEMCTEYSSIGIEYGDFDEIIKNFSSLSISDELVGLQGLKSDMIQIRSKYDTSRDVLSRIRSGINELSRYKLKTTKFERLYSKILKESDYGRSVELSEELISKIGKQRQLYIEMLQNNINKVQDYLSKIDQNDINVDESKEHLKNAIVSLNSNKYAEVMDNLRLAHSIAERQSELRDKIIEFVAEIEVQLILAERGGLSISQYSNRLNKLSKSSDYEQVLEDLSSTKLEIEVLLEDQRNLVEDRITACSNYLSGLLEEGISDVQQLLENLTSVHEQYTSGSFPSVLETLLNLHEAGKILEEQYRERSNLITEIRDLHEDYASIGVNCGDFEGKLDVLLDMKLSDTLTGLKELRTELLDTKNRYDASRDNLSRIQSGIDELSNYGIKTMEYEGLYSNILKESDYNRSVELSEELLSKIEERRRSYIDILQINIGKVRDYIGDLKEEGINVDGSRKHLKNAISTFNSGNYSEVQANLRKAHSIAERQLKLHDKIVEMIGEVEVKFILAERGGLSVSQYSNKLCELSESSDYNPVVEDLSQLLSEIEESIVDRHGSVENRLLNCNTYLQNLLNEGVFEVQSSLDDLSSVQEQFSAGYYSTVLEELQKLEEAGKELENQYQSRSKIVSEIQDLWDEYRSIGIDCGDIDDKLDSLMALGITDTLTGLESFKLNLLQIRSKYDASRDILSRIQSGIDELSSYGIETTEFEESYSNIIQRTDYERSIELSEELNDKIENRRQSFIHSLRINVEKVQDYLSSLEEEDINVDESKEHLEKALVLFDSEKYAGVMDVLRSANSIAERQFELHGKKVKLISEIEVQLNFAEGEGLPISQYPSRLNELSESSNYEQVLEGLSSIRSEIEGLIEERRSSVADRITACTDYFERLLTDGISETQPLLDNIPSIQKQYSAGHYTTVLESIFKLEESGKELEGQHKECSELLEEITEMCTEYTSIGIEYGDADEIIKNISSSSISDELAGLQGLKSNLIQIRSKFDTSRDILSRILSDLDELSNYGIETTEFEESYSNIIQRTDYDRSIGLSEELNDKIENRRQSFIHSLRINVEKVQDYLSSLEEEDINVDESKEHLGKALVLFDSEKYAGVMDILRSAHSIAERQSELHGQIFESIGEIEVQLIYAKRGGLPTSQYSDLSNELSESSDYEQTLENLSSIRIEIEKSLEEHRNSVENRLIDIESYLKALLDEGIFEAQTLINELSPIKGDFEEGYYSSVLEAIDKTEGMAEDIKIKYSNKKEICESIENSFQILSIGEIPFDNIEALYKSVLKYPIDDSLRELNIIKDQIGKLILDHERENKSKYDKLVVEITTLNVDDIYHDDLSLVLDELSDDMENKKFKIVNDKADDLLILITTRKESYKICQELIQNGVQLLSIGNEMKIPIEDLENGISVAQTDNNYEQSIDILTSAIEHTKALISGRENEFYDIITDIETEHNTLQRNYGISSQRLNQYTTNLRLLFTQKNYANLEIEIQKVYHEIDEERKIREAFIETHVNKKCVCGLTKEDGAIYCHNCGGAIVDVDQETFIIGVTKTCPYCTAQYEEAANYCEICGKELNPIPSSPFKPSEDEIPKKLPPPPPKGKRSLPPPPPEDARPLPPPPEDMMEKPVQLKRKWGLSLTDINETHNIELNEKEHLFGRFDFFGWAPDNNLVYISKKHFKIIKKGNQLFIEHLSQNQTKLNNIYLVLGKLTEIKEGDIIDLSEGNLTIKVTRSKAS